MDISVKHQVKGYDLQDRIGSGGFGAVYRAYQSTVGREVAIKVILPGLANQPEFVRRFEGEAQLIARLEHPHITPLYDYWRDYDGAYLVMRWLRGGSLKDSLNNGPFELRAAALLLDQIAGALSLAHRNGVIHRDIKPGNILLDEDGNAYLTDFGIAKDLNLPSSNTQQDAIIGSLDYLSPEQARSEQVTARTDIYSLGVTLYEVITGHHPFENMSPIERLYKHINDPLPEIANIEPELQVAVNRVIQQATAKNPEHRYPDALAFAADFREAIGLNRTSTTVVELLTQREQEILQLIIEGLPNKEIAQRLTVTLGTVKWYVNQIFSKLGVRSRVQAIVRARELHLIVKSGEAFASIPIPTEDFRPENPYKGLRAFQSADFQDYFGREKVTAHLIKRLSETGDFSRFLAVVGPSGSGKSSLVKAGLIPSLWRGDLAGSEKWFVVEMLPGSHPLDELEIALTRIAANQTSNLNEHLRRDKRGLVRIAGLILPNDGSELVLVIDQFEEVFTLLESEEERIQFLDLLYAAVTEQRSRVRVVVTLRADFYDRPLHYPQFGELVRNRLETIMPLSAEELERAIVKPAEQVGMTFEPGLVAAIIGDVNYQPGALPLLQYALTELFEQRQGHLLSRDAYQAIGGTVGALAKRAEELYQNLSATGQEAAHQMFLRLVTLGEGTENTRRRTSRSELLAVSDDSDLMDEILDVYAEYRLLALDNDLLTRTPTVEVAHEALLREWERLRMWLNESREDIRQERVVAQAADAWQTNHRDTSYLLSGARLEQVEKWNQLTELALTPLEREFIESSIAEREAHQKAETERQERETRLAQHSAKADREAANRLRYLVGVLVVFLLVATSLSLVTLQSRNNAINSFNQSESQRLAAESTNVLQRGDSPELAALLAIRGLQAQYSPQADAALLNASRYDYGERVFQAGESVTTIAYSPDGRYILNSGDTRTELWDAQTGISLHTFTVKTWNAGSAAAFSPNSNTVIVGNDVGEVHIWDTATGAELHVFSASSSPINCVAYSPDGRYILIASEDGQVHLMDAASGTVVRSFSANGGSNALAFSPDSQRIVVSSGDEVRVWEVESGTLIWTVLLSNTKNGAVFSPDGQYILIASFDKKAHLLDAATGQEIRQFVGHTDGVFTGIFSPDGQYVLTASLDQTARLWDTATGEELRRFSGHTSSVYVVAFTPDGRHILTAGRDATVRLWDIQASNERGTFSGAQGFMYVLRFSPDAQYVLIGTNDHTVRLFETVTANQLQVLTHPSILQAVQFIPDGNSILTGSFDGIVRLWDTRNGEMQRSFNEVMYGATFSLDGRFILAEGDAGTTILWDAVSGAKLHTVEHVGGLAFSPDSQYFAITNGDYEYVAVYETASGNLLNTIQVPGTPLSTVFSPDNSYILTGGRDNVVRLWDAATGQLVRQFVGHTNTIWNVAYSPDGRSVLSSSFDKTARLWDAATGEQLRSFPSHNFSAVSIVAYSPDGRSVLIGSTDGTAQLADADLDTLMQSVCTSLLRDFTDAERTIYGITDQNSTCANVETQPTAVAPTWTPVVIPTGE